MTLSKTRGLAAAAALAVAIGVMSNPAHAVDIDFVGYFRSGAGSSDEGGNLVCTRLPGSVLWFRLGNECDTYADLSFKSKLGEVDGTTFRSAFRFSYGTQGIAQWEQTSPALREAFVAADDIGAGMGMPALKGASLWMGKRFYGNRDIHILDYGFWEPNYGVGAGLENISTGMGKLSYAIFRIGDFAGYGVNTSLGGFNPDLIDGGSRSITVHDLRLEDIAANPGGRVTVGVDLARSNNRDGQATYVTETTVPVVGVDGNVYDAVVKQTNTIENKPGKNGFGLHLQHTQDNFLGLGGFHQVVLKYAKDAITLRGYGIAGTVDDRKEWLLFNHWVMEPKDVPITAAFTAGVRKATVNGVGSKEFWVGARPQYHINNIWSLMSEVGYQQARSDADAFGDRKLAKVTLGTQFSMGRSIWSRPAIRFFVTHTRWNDAAAAAGGVACTGRDCGTPVGAYDDKRRATTYGFQVEGWF